MRKSEGNAGRSPAGRVARFAAREVVLASADAFAMTRAGTGSSLAITAAGLSLRSPWNTEWRMRPSGVHSEKDTSATSSGRTQCPRASAGRLASADFSIASGLSARSSERSVESSKPVPTLPA
jgi:hypothetical protein